MIVKKMLLAALLLPSAFCPLPCFASDIFSPDEPIVDGINVIEMSGTFADVYEKLDSVHWAGKNISVAIESIEKINPDAHIAATDDRVVLVWGDAIVANYPRPESWADFGQVTTALMLKLRERIPELKTANADELYGTAVSALVRGIDENGRYVYARGVNDDNKILTSVGLEGGRTDRGDFRVTGVFGGSPADTSGVRDGDLIARINGATVRDMSDDEIADAISGGTSGTLKLAIMTPAGNKNIVLRRASVILADADIISRQSSVAGRQILEIIVHKISDNSVQIVIDALDKYSPTGIILDLRTATGDDEESAARMAGIFMGELPVMRIVETGGGAVEIVPGGAATTDAPVVVLMSDQTRGAAEALVSAFYENERGVLVGTPTAGAARLSTTIDLKNGGALELQNKLIQTGAGRTLDGRGVFPMVCLSNIRSESQQDAFFINVSNDSFNMHDFNTDENMSADVARRGCPVITSGADEDAVASAVAVKILLDDRVYGKLKN